MQRCVHVLRLGRACVTLESELIVGDEGLKCFLPQLLFCFCIRFFKFLQNASFSALKDWFDLLGNALREDWHCCVIHVMLIQWTSIFPKMSNRSFNWGWSCILRCFWHPVLDCLHPKRDSNVHVRMLFLAGLFFFFTSLFSWCWYHTVPHSLSLSPRAQYYSPPYHQVFISWPFFFLKFLT